MPLFFLSGSPGGSTTQLQYNNAGTFGGISGATADGTTVSLTAPKIVTSLLDVNGSPLIAITATGSAVYGLTLANAALLGTVALGVTPPTQVLASVAGTPISITSQSAVAGSATAGAAAGGSITITTGAANRLTSGNANGGNIVLATGAGIGTGVAGVVIMPNGVRAAPSLVFAGATTSGFWMDSGNIRASFGGTDVVRFGPSNTIGVDINSAYPLGWNSDASLSRIAAGVTGFGTGAQASRAGWLQWSGQQRMTADATNLTTAFSNLTDLTVSNLIAGRKYYGRLVIKCNNSQATEGIKFDFNGGSATMTSFWAAIGSLATGGVTAGTTISTSLAGAMNFTLLTGETVFVCEFSFVVNAAGTIIPRFAENSTAAGTATVELGSYITLDDSPN